MSVNYQLILLNENWRLWARFRYLVYQARFKQEMHMYLRICINMVFSHQTFTSVYCTCDRFLYLIHWQGWYFAFVNISWINCKAVEFWTHVTITECYHYTICCHDIEFLDILVMGSPYACLVGLSGKHAIHSWFIWSTSPKTDSI